MSSNSKSKPWLTVRHEAENGKVTQFVPRYVKPLQYLDVVEKHNVHQIEFVVDSILEEDALKRVTGTVSMPITFHNPCSIYGLVEGGWLPLPFVNPANFLVDRNVVVMLGKIAGGCARKDVPHTEWWFSLLKTSRFTIDPILYAWEGDRRRILDYDEFRANFNKGAEQISSVLPNANVIKFQEEIYRPAYPALTELSKRQEKEAAFLLYAAPLIKERVSTSKLEEYRRVLVNKAKELEVNLLSLVVIAAFSCLFEKQDGSGHLIARRILNPCKDYTEQDAYNALSDLRALELFIFTHTLRGTPFSLCTCDRPLAAFWCLLGVNSMHYSKGKMTFSVRLRTDLFPRLSPDELKIFTNEIGAD